MDKVIENPCIKSTLTYGRGYVYSLQYHIVWCTKYRKKVLSGDVETHLKQHLNFIAEEYHFSITAMETWYGSTRLQSCEASQKRSLIETPDRR